MIKEKSRCSVATRRFSAAALLRCGAPPWHAKPAERDAEEVCVSRQGTVAAAVAAVAEGESAAAASAAAAAACGFI